LVGDAGCFESQSFTGVLPETGEFAFQSLSVGSYQVGLTMPGSPDAYVKSVRVKDTEIPNGELQLDGLPPEGLQIVISRAGASVEGHVLNGSRQPVAGATVAILPVGLPPYTPARYRSAPIDSTGSFQLRGLAPGEYEIYAWEDVEDGAWFNPTFLRNYENNKRTLRLIEGQKQTAEILAVPIGQ
jgi:hypothetical protein